MIGCYLSSSEYENKSGLMSVKKNSCKSKSLRYCFKGVTSTLLSPFKSPTIHQRRFFFLWHRQFLLIYKTNRSLIITIGIKLMTVTVMIAKQSSERSSKSSDSLTVILEECRLFTPHSLRRREYNGACLYMCNFWIYGNYMDEMKYYVRSCSVCLCADADWQKLIMFFSTPIISRVDL